MNPNVAGGRNRKGYRIQQHPSIHPIDYEVSPLQNIAIHPLGRVHVAVVVAVVVIDVASYSSAASSFVWATLLLAIRMLMLLNRSAITSWEGTTPVTSSWCKPRSECAHKSRTWASTTEIDGWVALAPAPA
mmetsp:Transcript_25877/g.56732  ORF Transcript_25877/g.56732 Transcript_25877/m.56732 type:complete len:131 (-) Transcript_25877:1692-2084(-)